MPKPPTTRVFRSRIFAFLLAEADRRGLRLAAHFPALQASTSSPPLIALEDLHRLGDLLAEASGDAWIGIHLAQEAPRGLFAVTEYLGRSAPSLGVAIERMVDFGALINPHVGFAFDPTRRLVSQRVAGVPSCLGRQVNELTLVHQVLFARMATGRPLAPEQVRLAHPRPCGDLTPLETALGTTALTFDTGENGLVFHAGDLRAELVTADPTLAHILERGAREQLPPRDDLASVREALTVLMASEAPRAGRLAELLGTSERSLHRRLADKGTSFRAMLDATRAEIASHALDNGPIALEELAEQLGYADPSAFTRAFRRWRGMSPSRYRNRSKHLAP